MKKPQSSLRLALACALLALASATAHAAAAPIPGLEKIELLAGWQTAKGTHMAGLRLRLKPGWKTYWRAPGDAGIPPQFDWAGSQNLAAARLLWPRPEVVTTDGIRSVVYHNDVVIPIELTATDPDKPIEINATVELGVCKDICVPVNTRFDIVLPADRTAPDARILAALKARPERAAQAGVRTVSCTATPTRDGLHVTARIDMPPIGQNEITILEAPDPSVWVSETQSTRNGDILTASADMVPPSGAPFTLDRAKVRITVLGSDRAVDIKGCEAGEGTN